MAFYFFEPLFPVCTQNGNFWTKKKKTASKTYLLQQRGLFLLSRPHWEKLAWTPKLWNTTKKTKTKQIQAITTWECVVGNKISLRKLREIQKFGDDYIRVNLNRRQRRGISLKGRQSIQNHFSVGLGPPSNWSSCASTSIPCSFQCIHDKSNLGMLQWTCNVITFMRPETKTLTFLTKAERPLPSFSQCTCCF